MRKLLMLLSFLCLTLSAFSQKGVEVGVLWSPQVYRILNEDDINFLEYNNFPVSVSNFGAWLAINPKKGVGIYIGAIYAQQGQEYIGGVAQRLRPVLVDNLSKIKLTYFKFPLLFQVRKNAFQSDASQQRKIGFNFMIGPQVNLLYQAKWFDLEKKEIKVIGDAGQVIKINDAYDKININLALALGLNYPLSKRTSFSLLFKADYALEDIENKSFSISSNPFYSSLRLASSSISVAVQPTVSWLFSK